MAVLRILNEWFPRGSFTGILLGTLAMMALFSAIFLVGKRYNGDWSRYD